MNDGQCEAPTGERCGVVDLTACGCSTRPACFGRGTAPLAKQYPADADRAIRILKGE